MYEIIGQNVSEILGLDISEIIDIDLIDGTNYKITIETGVYTYDAKTNTLTEGIIMLPEPDDKLTEDEKRTYAEQDMNLIHHILKSVNHCSIPYDELYAVGSLGFAKALNAYRKNKGTKFSTYACYCVKNEVLFFLKKEQKHTQNLSFSQTMATDKNGHDLALGDLLSEADIGKLSLEECYEHDELKETLLGFVEKLDENDQYIIRSRFGLGIPRKTQQELAQEYGMTQANISKMQQNVMRRLRIKIEIANRRINYS